MEYLKYGLLLLFPVKRDFLLKAGDKITYDILLYFSFNSKYTNLQTELKLLFIQ